MKRRFSEEQIIGILKEAEAGAKVAFCKRLARKGRSGRYFYPEQALVKFVLGNIFTDAPVNYVATVPGKAGACTALIAEAVISCGMMLMVLFMTNTTKLARFTGLLGGTLVFLYITFEAPLSGMSINPARTVASAWPSGIWTAGWIYLVAPIGGMLLAVEIYRMLKEGAQVACAKWNHDPRQRCIFCGHSGKHDD